MVVAIFFSKLTLWLSKIVYLAIFFYDMLFNHHRARNGPSLYSRSTRDEDLLFERKN